jgi:hypothetical protein
MLLMMYNNKNIKQTQPQIQDTKEIKIKKEDKKICLITNTEKTSYLEIPVKIETKVYGFFFSYLKDDLYKGLKKSILKGYEIKFYNDVSVKKTYFYLNTEMNKEVLNIITSAIVLVPMMHKKFNKLNENIVREISYFIK